MYIEIKDIKKLIDAGYTVIKAKWADKQQKIYLKKVQVGKGERTFFICPCCGSNANKLYLDKFGYKCVHCTSLKMYSGIQNTTKGGYSYIEYKWNDMRKIMELVHLIILLIICSIRNRNGNIMTNGIEI